MRLPCLALIAISLWFVLCCASLEAKAANLTLLIHATLASRDFLALRVPQVKVENKVTR